MQEWSPYNHEDDKQYGAQCYQSIVIIAIMIGDIVKTLACSQCRRRATSCDIVRDQNGVKMMTNLLIESSRWGRTSRVMELVLFVV